MPLLAPRNAQPIPNELWVSEATSTAPPAVVEVGPALEAARKVKLSSHPSRADTSGILALRRSHARARIARGLVVAPCDTSYSVSDHELARPWDAR